MNINGEDVTGRQTKSIQADGTVLFLDTLIFPGLHPECLAVRLTDTHFFLCSTGSLIHRTDIPSLCHREFNPGIAFTTLLADPFALCIGITTLHHRQPSGRRPSQESGIFQLFSFSAFQLFSFSAFQLFSFSAFQLSHH
ncbi:hypothetical protein [Enterobacter ludwigii]|uniref:hypothetical protein n=1 Tax=Enterobacter ludwigii TaxID=299767 RepID=UPI003F723901